jgi:hypothetical protein
MPGFNDTATFFEARAGKAKSPERQAELADTATFYRTLGRITATFPFGYRQPGAIPPNGSRTAERLLGRSEECRAMAEAMRDPACRAALMRLADTYEQVARSGA